MRNCLIGVFFGDKFINIISLFFKYIISMFFHNIIVIQKFDIIILVIDIIFGIWFILVIFINVVY